MASLFSGAAVIVLVYIFLKYDVAAFIQSPTSEFVLANPEIPPVGAILVGVFALCIFTGLFVVIHKFREYQNEKAGMFRTDLASEGVGGFICFLMLAAGIFLRVKTCIDKSISSMSSIVDTANIESAFASGIKLDFSSSNAFYDSVVAFVYRFAGVKSEAYMWVNVVMHIIVILLLYSSIRNVFNSFVAVIPVAYMCFTKEQYELVVTGGYENIPLIACLFCFFVFTAIIPLFSNMRYFGVINLILTLLGEVGFLCVMPLFFTNDIISGAPVFQFVFSDKVQRLFFPSEFNGLCVVIFVLIFFASISLLFNERDRLSLIFPFWVLCTFFYLFAKYEWPSDLMMYLIFGTFAGLGLDELILSRISLDEELEFNMGDRKPQPDKRPKTKAIKPDKAAETAVAAEEETKPDIIGSSVPIYYGVPKPEIRNITETIDETVVAESVAKPETELIEESASEPIVAPVLENVCETPVEETPATKEETSHEDISEEKVASEPSIIPISEDAVSEASASEGSAVEEADSETETESVAEPEKIKLFETPLPLPKKHEKKEISYKFEPDADHMKFDVEIAEDDDFDI